MNGRIKARTLLIASITGLVLLLLLGGAGLALAEGIAYLSGVWLSFCVITTSGFGTGPVTSGGLVVSMVLFVIAAVHWFGILLAAFEIGVRRAKARPSLLAEVEGSRTNGGGRPSRHLYG